MNINSPHHNLLGNQISSKSEDFCIWRPFCTLVTMAYDVANLYSSLVCYGGYFESKMAAKIKQSSDLGEIWFPSRFWCWELIFMVWEPYYDPPCRNIHRSMWQLLGDWKNSKWGPLPW
jgi:hypothetical protein